MSFDAALPENRAALRLPVVAQQESTQQLVPGELLQISQPGPVQSAGVQFATECSALRAEIEKLNAHPGRRRLFETLDDAQRLVTGLYQESAKRSLHIFDRAILRSVYEQLKEVRKCVHPANAHGWEEWWAYENGRRTKDKIVTFTVDGNGPGPQVRFRTANMRPDEGWTRPLGQSAQLLRYHGICDLFQKTGKHCERTYQLEVATGFHGILEVRVGGVTYGVNTETPLVEETKVAFNVRESDMWADLNRKPSQPKVVPPAPPAKDEGPQAPILPKEVPELQRQLAETRATLAQKQRELDAAVEELNRQRTAAKPAEKKQIDQKTGDQAEQLRNQLEQRKDNDRFMAALLNQLVATHAHKDKNNGLYRPEISQRQGETVKFTVGHVGADALLCFIQEDDDPLHAVKIAFTEWPVSPAKFEYHAEISFYPLNEDVKRIRWEFRRKSDKKKFPATFEEIEALGKSREAFNKIATEKKWDSDTRGAYEELVKDLYPLLRAINDVEALCKRRVSTRK